jgi:RNA polymerase sigma-70 factor (ECF subfamily)
VENRPAGTGSDTSLGGAGRDFPATSWGLIVRLTGDATTGRRDALEGLCRRYWKPVYHFSRRAWSKKPEDAKDLAQGFFAWLLEGDALQRYAPARGSFRSYLKVLLRGFAADQNDAERALKRGGGKKVLALDDADAPLHDIVPDDSAAPPEEAFDRAWKEEILRRAVDRARAWFQQSGRAHQFRAFEEVDLAPGEKPTYAAAAERLGLKETLVRNYLFEVRERVRAEIRAELAQTVSDFEQLEEEWTALFGR